MHRVKAITCVASYPGPPFNFACGRAWYAKICHVTSLWTMQRGCVHGKSEGLGSRLSHVYV